MIFAIVELTWINSKSYLLYNVQQLTLLFSFSACSCWFFSFAPLVFFLCVYNIAVSQLFGQIRVLGSPLTPFLWRFSTLNFWLFLQPLTLSFDTSSSYIYDFLNVKLYMNQGMLSCKRPQSQKPFQFLF